jgi:hypothetical protein
MALAQRLEGAAQRSASKSGRCTQLLYNVIKLGHNKSRPVVAMMAS